MKGEIKNAVIESVSLSTADHGCLSGWMHLSYGGSGQGFGGYDLHVVSRGFKSEGVDNMAGHFITRCIEIGGVMNWENLPGQTVRVDAVRGVVHGIGHILNDDWFYPSEDFNSEE